ncbi:hypothetical protein KY311_00790 [Candidatus Woesearchaeota archaeon]|nr:hypothetical protein [Candidatus Woesearchaeota archaeon]
MKILFWCEFPEKCNWERLERFLSINKYHTGIYVTSRSRKEFDEWKRIIKKKCRHINEVNVWPVLRKNKGYWFSAFNKKSDIDRLLEYKGLKVKVDLEPPLPRMRYNVVGLGLYGISKIIFPGKNIRYLESKIRELAKHSQILSNEFPIPAWASKRIAGHTDARKVNNVEMNFISYSTFFRLTRPLANFYYSVFAKSAIKKYNDKAMFSIGMLGPGIFTNEPCYTSPGQLREDIELMKKAGAKKLAIYSIEGLSQRKNPTEWIKVVKEYSD